MLSSHHVTLQKSCNFLHVNLRSLLTTNKADTFSDVKSASVKCHVKKKNLALNWETYHSGSLFTVIPSQVTSSC